MSQSEDINAIDAYIRRTIIKTGQADQLQDAWVEWFDDLGTLEKNFDSGILVEAKQRRDAFNSANILTATSAPNVSGKTPMATNRPLLLPGTRPTIREGSKGAAVGEWQRFLELEDDEKFGPITKKATEDYQAPRGLDPDGVVGPMTWGKAIEESAAAAVTSAGTSVAAIANQAAAAVAAAVNQPVPTPAQVEAAAHQAVQAVAAAVNPTPAPKPPKPSVTTPVIQPPGVVETIKGTLSNINARTPLWAKVAGGGLAGVAAIVGIRSAGKR